MKSSLETTSHLARKLNIEVPAAEVQAAFQRALTSVQKSVAIKGFRKGKAPLATIRSIYGERLKQDVIQDIIQHHFISAVREHSLEPIGSPAIEFDSLEDNKDFAFSAEFEIHPVVNLKQVEGLKVQKEKLEITDESVLEALENVRKARADVVPVLEDRLAQNGDVAVIDFKGFINGQALENGSAENYELELGSKTFLPGFEEGVVGMRVSGQTTIKTQFPEGYHAAELSGKPVEFQVSLKGLKTKKLPELNDEFAKGLGPFDNLEALKSTIRDDFQRREGARIDEDLKNRLMRLLVEKNPVDVPKNLLAEQKKMLVEDFKRRMSQQGMDDSSFADYEKKWDSDFEQTASFMIQSSFLVDKIANEQKLVATPNEIEMKMREFALSSGIDFKEMSKFYQDKDNRSRLAHRVTEEKVVDWLLSKSQIEEVAKDKIEKSAQ